MRATLRILVILFSLAGFQALLAQSNPVPFVNQPLVPSATAPGSHGFVLTVNGTGFVSGAAINWNKTPLATTFVSDSQLTAAVAASDVANATTATITVSNPSPGGGTSHPLFFSVTPAVGTPTFSNWTVLTSVQGCDPIIAADFNGDGKLDLACSDRSNASGAGALHVFLGNGDGTFQAPTTYATGNGPFSLVTADFNGDGKLDIAVVNNSGVSIYLGNGDGTFHAPSTFSTASGTVGLFAADLRRIGRLDLVVGANVGSSAGYSVLLGNGDGTFETHVDYTAPDSILDIGDVNQDGKLDLIGADRQSGQIFVLPGNGDGTFGSAILSSANFTVQWGSLADFNGDGSLDLGGVWLCVGLCNNAYFQVALGGGNDTFQDAAQYGADNSSNKFVTPDLNGDGKLDLVTIVYTTGTYDMAFGNGDGTFSNPLGFGTPYNPTYSFAVGDFDNDGTMDLATFAPNPTGGQPGWLTLTLQSAAIASVSPTTLPLPAQVVGTTSSTQPVTLLNTGSGTMKITSIAITGSDSGDFSQTNTCSSSLAPGHSCQINVAFTPTALGTRNAGLSLADNAPGSPQVVALSGTGEDFSLRVTSQTSLTVTPGQVANYSIAVSPVSGSAQKVALTCSGAPPQSTCTISPNSVTLGASANVAVVTSATSSGLVRPASFRPMSTRFASSLAFSGLSGLLLLRGGVRKRRSRALCWLLPACVLLLVITWSSCGGGSGGAGAGGTPPGTYNLTVSGTFTAGLTKLEHDVTLTLVVQ